MVKLKVTARIIPEDLYLSSVDSSAAPNALIRGERRLLVVVREPEDWYIGTLAVQIKTQYKNLYKHDLGQIKYLKDNQDDCDLDPDLHVNDVLVDEGKSLTDASDQHVTIKVIQEQGRSLRHGSVVPDLSQVHYQLPERLSRPPVPSFNPNNVKSSLGKRKSDSELQRASTEKKRTRLDEIEEEEELVASIEREQPLQSDVVMDSTQFIATSPLASKQRQAKQNSSPALTWSFSKLGPPTAVQESPQKERTREHNSSFEKSSNGHQQTDEPDRTHPVNRTPGVGSPRANGVQTVSPLAAASDASKKFLKPRMNLYVEPESEIDDSQMSPASRNTTRITPRLVPSGKAADLNRLNSAAKHRSVSRGLSELSEQSVNSMSQHANQAARDVISSWSNKVSGPNENEAGSVLEGSSEVNAKEQGQDGATRITNGATQAPGRTDSPSESEEPDRENVTSSGVTSNKVDDLASKENQLADKTHSETIQSRSGGIVDLPGQRAANQPPLTKSIIPSFKTNGRVKEVSDASSDVTSRSSDSQEKSRRRRRQRNDGDMDIVDPEGSSVNNASERQRSGSSILSAKQSEGKNSRDIIPAVARAISTPALDSPSEQLSQALQESARRTTTTRVLDFEPVKPMAAKDLRKSRVSPVSSSRIEETGSGGTISKSNHETNNETMRKKTSSEERDDHSSIPLGDKMDLDQANKVVNPVPVTVPDGASTTKSTNEKTVLLPPDDQAAREVSTDSRTPSVSKGIVMPPGMTMEQYDLARKHYALNMDKLKAAEKKKSTPALRQSPSIEVSGLATSTPSTKAKSVRRIKDVAPAVMETPEKKTAKASGEATSALKTTEATSDKTSTSAIKSVAGSDSHKGATMLKSTSSKATSVKATTVANSSPAPPDSSVSKNLKNTSAKPPSVVSSIPSMSTKSASQSSQKLPIPAGPKLSSPSPSNTSKVTSSSKVAPKEPASTNPKVMLPPSSSSVTKVSTAMAATPTPKSRTRSTAAKATKPAPVSAANSSQSKPSTRKRPAPPPAFSSARSLQELRAMANSAANSTASNSPAPSTSRFAPAKKSILNNDSESSTESSSEDDEISTEITTSKAKPSSSSASKPSTTAKKPALKGRPDPTIRDASIDSSEAESGD